MLGMKVDMKRLDRMIRNYPSQIRFAAAKALTKTAQQAQEAEIADVDKHFDTTRKWAGKNQPTGIKIKPATKRQLRSRVYTGPKNTWAGRQEFGESKNPRKGTALIIPTYQKSGGGLGKKDKKWAGIRRETWQKAIGKRTAYAKYTSRSMSAVTRSGNQRRYPAVFDTESGATFIRRKKNSRPELLFVQKKGAKPATKKWGFRKRVKALAKRNARVNFSIAMRQAVRTMK